MKALNEYVLIEPITRNELANKAVAIKGFILDIKHQAEPQTGYVRFIGGAVTDNEYSIGDTVIFNEPHPQGFTNQGVDYIPVKHEQIIAKVKGLQ